MSLAVNERNSVDTKTTNKANKPAPAKVALTEYP